MSSIDSLTLCPVPGTAPGTVGAVGAKPERVPVFVGVSITVRGEPRQPVNK